MKKEFYFEPTVDFQVDSPANHSISNLFYWGDWIALYNMNPYVDYDKYIPGCTWQIPSGSTSFHSTIPLNECRNKIINLIKQESKHLFMCVWSYKRFWEDKSSGPCLCCELNFEDCSECYKCFKNAKVENKQKLNHCLFSDKLKNSKGTDSLSCYKCLNIKNPTFNCQSYEHFLVKLIQEYQKKIPGVTSNSFFD